MIQHGEPAEFDALAHARVLNARSLAQLEDAMNLLRHAVRRIEDGDREAADRLVAMAVAMPYDPREKGSPGVMAAAQLIYDLVYEHLDDSAQDESTWLTAALDVHDRLDGPGRAQLASSLHSFTLPGDQATLTELEELVIRQACGDAPREADLEDRAEATPLERALVVGSLLGCLLDLRSAYDEL